MTKNEALKLALEALEEAWYHVGTFQPTEKAIDLYDEARAAIKEALAQTEQEPVAYINVDKRSLEWASPTRWLTPTVAKMERVALYASPPQRQPLTDDKLDALALDDDGLPNSHFEFARAIEKAHGIGDKT